MHAQTNLQLYDQCSARPPEERLLVRDAYELATLLFAGRFRGCGKPFVSHLVGTASVLEHHDASLPVVIAGLLHAAYAQGDFGGGKPGLRESRRMRMRQVVGREAEDLVARYTTFDWSRVPDRLEQADLPVVFMRVANEIDECADRGLLHVNERKRDETSAGVTRFAAAARGALGLPKLAKELETAFGTNSGSLPDGLAADRDWSYVLDKRTRRRRLRELGS